MKPTKLTPSSSRSTNGFSLMEMMLVMAIIGILVATVGFFGSGILASSKEQRVDSDLKNIETALQSYQSGSGTFNYPTTAQGLKALVERPSSEPIPRRWHQSLKEMPIDPWGKEYKYSSPGTHNKEGFDIYSVGADGQDGTSDDIGNWK